MKHIVFIAEKTRTGYSAYTKYSDGSIIATTGSDMVELKFNALEAYNALMEYLNEAIIIDEQLHLVMKVN